MMNDEGYDWFGAGYHTYLWNEKLEIDRNNTQYGVWIGSSFMWYDNWIPIVRKYCHDAESK